VALTKHHDVVKAFPSDRTDQPLCISALPQRPRRARSVPYAHCGNAPDEGSAIRPVPITDQVTWRLVPAAGLGQLTGEPFGIGMSCHAQPQKVAA
jgi:hypothetical protein